MTPPTGMHMTEEEFLQIQARIQGNMAAKKTGKREPPNSGASVRNIDQDGVSPSRPCIDTSTPDEGSEAKLQAKAERYCEEHGYVWFHDRSRKCNRKGFVDLVVALPGGRTVWIEFKSKGGRLRPEQATERDKLEAMSHKWCLVRSYRQFLGIIAEGGK